MEADKYHEEAVNKLGKSYKEQMNTWAMAYAFHDIMVWRLLKRELGREKGRELFLKLWTDLARNSADAAIKTIDVKKVDIHTLGEIARQGYSILACPYKIISETPDEHIAQVTECPFHRYNDEMFGDHASSEEMRMYWQDTADATNNYFKTIVEHLGLSGQIEAGSDKFLCTGDEYCTVFFKRKKK